MPYKIIIALIALLFSTYGLAQIEVDRIEEDYVTTTQSAIVIEAARSVTIKPDSHLKSGSNVSIRIDESAYIPPTFTTGNYVFSRSYQKALTDPDQISSLTDVIEKISYYDGLGRISQDIEVKYTPYRYDLIKPFEYDNVGRQAKEFLPYKALGDNAVYRSDALTAVNTFYLSEYGGDLNSGNPNPFSEKEFEDASLGRTSKQASPGYDWRLGGGNEIEFDYKLNSSSDGVRYFKVTFANSNTESPQLVESGTYAANQLTREIIKDENHSGSTKNHTKEEFKDKRGRVVLKRTYADTGGNTQVQHDTYYVYDDYDNLTYVIPPEASKNSTISTSVLNNVCYQYKYDFKNRLIEKKIPGKGGTNNYWETTVYNTNDQPILTQDPNLKASDAWLFTKYDAYGRIAYTGRMVRDASRATLQGEANNASETFVRRKANYQVDGENVGYYNTAYPTSNITEIYTINYYDNYTGFDMEGLSVPSTVFGISTNVNAIGLPTCTKVRILDWPQNLYAWVTAVIGYDEKGRVIYEAQETPYAYDYTITNIKESRLDFTGRTLEAKTTHKRVQSADIVSTDIFEYDHMGRLLTQTQTLGGQTEVLVNNVYDELGNVEQKKLGNTKSNPLQTVDYKYNIRGWLKEINNVNSLGNDLFAYKLNFNNPEVSSLGANALYNGNIAETLWRSKNDDVKRAYGFTYDAMNRIKAAAFTDNMASNTGEYATSYSYDLNGNIQSLVRNGWQNGSNYANMDNLVYSYENNNPNKLIKVQDNGNDNYGFKDLANTATEYLYDANGNLTDDANKEITNISYNHLNLPVGITFTKNGQTSYISYLYDASGAKLKKTVLDRTVSPEQTTTTLYTGNYIYQNSNLKFIQHSEGYTELDSNQSFSYVYHYKDQLGNIRLAFSDINDNGSVDASEIKDEKNYYPFGLTQEGYNTAIQGSYYAFGFNGKEENPEIGLNWLDFSARNYNPELGRWMNIDPLAHEFPSYSPYVYALNNPVSFIDSDGKAPDPVLLKVINEAIQNNAIRQARLQANIYLSKYSSYGVEELSVTNVIASIPNTPRYRYSESSSIGDDLLNFLSLGVATIAENNISFAGQVNVDDNTFNVGVNYDKKAFAGLLEIKEVYAFREGENRETGNATSSGYNIGLTNEGRTIITLSVKDEQTHEAFEKAQKQAYEREFQKLLNQNPVLQRVYEIERLRGEAMEMYRKFSRTGYENASEEEKAAYEKLNTEVRRLSGELRNFMGNLDEEFNKKKQ